MERDSSLDDEPLITTRKIVVEALKSRGLEDPEAQRLLTAWGDQLRAKAHADAANDPNAANTSEDNLACNLEIAWIYIDAGYLDAAAIALEDIYDMASQESKFEFCKVLRAAIDAYYAEWERANTEETSL